MVLYFPIKQFSPRFGDEFFTFQISSYEVVKSDSCCGYLSYVVYIVEVMRGKSKWTLKYRFSKFEELHKLLLSSFPITMPTFPPKTLFRTTEDNIFLEERQKAISTYLDMLLKTLTEQGGVDNTCAATFLRLNGSETTDIFQADDE